MLSLCAEGQGADGFDQIDRLASGHERDRLTVDCGNAVFAVIAVERQRERREILVVEIKRQGDFLLPGGFFVREADGGQRAQGGTQIVDVKFFVVIRPTPFCIPVVRIFGQREGKRVGFAL